MCALTMEDNVFVHVEDPAAPTKADVLAAAPPGQEAAYLQIPTHYRTTFLTLTPPNALEQILSQLKARWVPVRQSSGTQKAQVLGPQLTIEGHIFARSHLLRLGSTLGIGSVDLTDTKRNLIGTAIVTYMFLDARGKSSLPE